MVAATEQRTCFFIDKWRTILNYSDAGLDIQETLRNTLGTLWEYIYTLQVVSFLVFGVF